MNRTGFARGPQTRRWELGQGQPSLCKVFNYMICN